MRRFAVVLLLGSVVLTLGATSDHGGARSAPHPLQHDPLPEPTRTVAGPGADEAGPGPVLPNGAHVGALDDVGQVIFWRSERVSCEEEPDDRDHPSTDPCASVRFRHTVDVARPGSTLRVAVDHPWRGDRATLSLAGPGTRQSEADRGFSVELTAEEAAAGRWTITGELSVVGRPSQLRFRVALQDPPSYQPRVLPNLQPLPPYEFTLDAPLVHTNFTVIMDGNNPRGPAGVGCTADETAERGVVNCLRFSTGPMNAGAGDLDIEFDLQEDAGDLSNPVYQWIRDSLGRRVERRDAGSYEFHATHAHYHYADLMRYELHRVVDPGTGELELAGGGHKSGFCTVSQGLSEWEAVHAARIDRATGNCGLGNPGTFGLSAGWGDVYRWQRNGQYVDLGLFPTDGRYVVRALVDPEDWVLEADEGDNVSYAYIDLEGRTVTTLERGIGSDPWDPRKVVTRDGRW